MPGYHIERVGGQGLHASEAAPSASVEALEEMQWAMAGTLPHDLPAAAWTKVMNLDRFDLLASE